MKACLLEVDGWPWIDLEEEGEGEAALANAVAGHTSGRLTTMTHSVVRRSGPKNGSTQSVIKDVALTVT